MVNEKEQENVKKLITIIIMTNAVMFTSSVYGTDLSIHSLTTEYAVNPLGIDETSPRFSWKLQSAVRGRNQTAYRILVASSQAELNSDHGDVWDTGRVNSGQTVGIGYSGPALQSGDRYYWKVQGWDDQNELTEWSEPSWFEMGLLSPSDWQGQWIARTENSSSSIPSPLLRKEFNITKAIERARLYISGLGYNYTFINGEPVSDHVLDPGFTPYHKRVLYTTHDVTSHIQEGSNCLGVELGRGFYAIKGADPWNWSSTVWNRDPRMIVQLDIEYTDGSSGNIVSDTSWKTSEGPVRSDNMYTGEEYDSRHEKPGWNQPGYDESGWSNAIPVDGPGGTMTSQMLQPIRRTGSWHPVGVSKPAGDSHLFDAGIVTTGWARLTASAPSGTHLTIKYHEKLSGGRIDDNFGSQQGLQRDEYIYKGQGVETYEPKFQYKGFRYVEVIGFPGNLTTDDLEIIEVHSDIPMIGQFECSNNLLNTMQALVVRTLYNNYHSIPTDTPLYEKNGWMGDACVMMDTMIYNMDMTRFLNKWSNDIRDNQRADGELPFLSPTDTWGIGTAVEWNVAYHFLVWYVYLHSGDIRIVEDHYDNLKRYIDRVYTYGFSGGTYQWGGYGDWNSPNHEGWPPEGPKLSATAYFYRSVEMLKEMASLLGRSGDVTSLTTMLDDIRNGFNNTFLDWGGNFYRTGETGEYRQTCNLLPLDFGIVPSERRGAVFNNLVNDVQSRGDHLNTGCVGTRHVLPVLTENGRLDLAYSVATQTSFPSWGFWVSQGATSLWEKWDTGARSYDHYFFGSYGMWFYEHLGGIKPTSAGFETIQIKPYLPDGLNYVNADIDTVRGMVSSHWQKQDTNLALDVTIPAGSTATIYVPANGDRQVLEGGVPAEAAEGLVFIQQSSDYAVYSAESGQYAFLVTDGTTPLPAQNLEAIALSGSEIRLQWDDMSDNESGFIVQRRPYNSDNNWHTLDTLPADTTSYTDTDNICGLIEYTYRIGAYAD